MIRAMLSLTSRQSFILNRVVDTFIGTGHPVSSQTIAFASPYPISSATVRNEMGALEDSGYLAQEHQCSGRVPTDRGYRHYLNCGIEAQESYQEYFLTLSEHFSNRYKKREDLPGLVEESAAVLSELSRQLGLLFVPDAGQVLSKEPRLGMKTEGLRYLLEQPECQDASKLRPLVKAIEEKESLKKWITAHAQLNASQAFVGTEHQVEDLENYAIVTARYETGHEGGSGAIAVIGLRRMAYSKVLPIVSEMACLIGQAVRRMEEIR